MVLTWAVPAGKWDPKASRTLMLMLMLPALQSQPCTDIAAKTSALQPRQLLWLRACWVSADAASALEARHAFWAAQNLDLHYAQGGMAV